MKAKKILKRIAKIEALMSEVTERSSASATHIQELLREAKTAIARAKKAVSSQASSGTVKNPRRKVLNPHRRPRRNPSNRSASSLPLVEGPSRKRRRKDGQRNVRRRRSWHQPLCRRPW